MELEESLAIVLDNKIISAPVIRDAIVGQEKWPNKWKFYIFNLLRI